MFQKITQAHYFFLSDLELILFIFERERRSCTLEQSWVGCQQRAIVVQNVTRMSRSVRMKLHQRSGVEGQEFLKTSTHVLRVHVDRVMHDLCEDQVQMVSLRHRFALQEKQNWVRDRLHRQHAQLQEMRQLQEQEWTSLEEGQQDKGAVQKILAEPLSSRANTSKCNVLVF